MTNPAEARRRWFGMFFLLIALGLLVWGQTVLQPHLRGMGFILYWVACFVFTGLAMLTALLDMRAVRRRIRDQQRDLVQRTIRRMEEEEKKNQDRP